VTPEEAQALWNDTRADTFKQTMERFASFVFSRYPEFPRAMRIRFDNGTRQGRWEEDVVSDAAEAAEAAYRIDGMCDIYIVPNPLKRTPAAMVTDDDIARLCFRLYDLDAKNVDGDIAACGEQMLELSEYLADKGHDQPLAGCTGNGYCLIERIDAENTTEQIERARKVLQALKARWSCIDVSTYNPARLFRFLGTTNRSSRDAGKDGRPKRSRLILPRNYTPRVIA
jgi:hypothetical protein